MRYLFSLLFLVLNLSFLAGQHAERPHFLQERINGDFYSRRQVSAADFFRTLKEELALSDGTTMQLIRETGDEEHRHYRYQQFFEGIPVFGHQVILHETHGIVSAANGIYTPDLNISVTPAIDAGIAAAKAISYMKDEEKTISSSPIRIDTTMLVLIDPAYPRFSGAVGLAYQVEMTQDQPFGRHRMVIDAHSGRKILSHPLIYHNSVTGDARTRYYGTRTITSDSVDVNKFLLRDLTRGNGIFVYDQSGTIFESKSRHWDLTNDKGDDVALDAMYCSAKFYDFLESRYQWSGVDGHGMAMACRIHDNYAGKVNAYWDRQYANFGDGNCDFGPLTTLEIVGHEFTHGIIDHTSGLLYFDESGALNESLADMMGKALEYFEDPANFSWYLGTSFRLNPDARPFRSMDNPRSMNMPAYYKGEYWIDGGEVHTNSAIGNLWFAMLCDGRSGISEGGIAYNITGMGMEKAARIAFHANRDYCFPGTNYRQFAKYTISVAGELYGPGSAEAEAVRESWKATGVLIPGSEIQKDLAIHNVHNQLTLCGHTGYVPITIILANDGEIPYDPAEGAYIALNNTSTGSRNIPIDQVIPPGASIVIQVDDWAIFTGNNFETFNYDIIWQDEVADNNYGYYFIQFKEGVNNDLAVSMFNGNAGICKDFSSGFTVSFSNHSCLPIAKGSVIRLKVRNSTQVVIHEEDITLNEDLQPLTSIYRIVDLPIEDQGQNVYNCTAELEGDPDVFNNNGTTSVLSMNTIDSDYSQDFEQFTFPSWDIYIGAPTFLVTTLYQGESWLGFTGGLYDTATLQHCSAPGALFDGYPNGIIRACIDFSDSPESSFEFDAIGFRNTYATNHQYPYSIMLRISWSGTGSDTRILYGFEEGQRGHYAFDLPPFFKGNVTIEYYTEMGTNSITSQSFINDDVLLLTNLQFNKTRLDTKVLTTDNTITVHPNPTAGNLRISTSDGIQYEQYQIFDSYGRVIASQPLSGSELDIRHLPAGSYWIQLHSATRQGVVKVMKM